MILKLSLSDIKYLKQLGVCNDNIYMKVEISKSASEYCKALIESNYKFEKELLREPTKIENDTLYKKLCGGSNA